MDFQEANTEYMRACEEALRSAECVTRNMRQIQMSMQPNFLGDRVSAFFGLPKAKSSKPLQGWRAWNLVREPFKLASIAVDVIWDGPRMTTNVLPNGELSKPTINNPAGRGLEGRGDWGVYAYKEPMSLYCNIDLIAYKRVLGRVSLSGKIIEHELGFRAQKAMIQELWVMEGHANMRQIITSLERAYACPIHTFSNPYTWARDFSPEQTRWLPVDAKTQGNYDGADR